jgi:hypothetical protein
MRYRILGIWLIMSTGCVAPFCDSPGGLCMGSGCDTSMQCDKDAVRTECKVGLGRDGCEPQRKKVEEHTAQFLCSQSSDEKYMDALQYCESAKPRGIVARLWWKVLGAIVAVFGILFGLLTGSRNARIAGRRQQLGIPPEN